MKAAETAIGVIGGSGLYELEGLSDVKWQKVQTPFGTPSDAYCVGRFGGRPVIFLPRHGRGHRVTPSELNFRANIWGMRFLGARWVISISAVGSMKAAIRPLDLVIPDQFFDATKRRESSFFGDGIVAHIGMAEPVCPDLALAREAELCYATLALATDYDVWHETHEAVTVEAVIQNLLKNVVTAKDVLRRVIPT